MDDVTWKQTFFSWAASGESLPSATETLPGAGVVRAAAWVNAVLMALTLVLGALLLWVATAAGTLAFGFGSVQYRLSEYDLATGVQVAIGIGGLVLALVVSGVFLAWIAWIYHHWVRGEPGVVGHLFALATLQFVLGYSALFTRSLPAGTTSFNMVALVEAAFGVVLLVVAARAWRHTFDGGAGRPS